MASTRLQRAFFEGRFTRGYARKIRTRAVSRARQIVSVFPEEIHPPDLVDSHLCGMDTSREFARIENRTNDGLDARSSLLYEKYPYFRRRASVRPSASGQPAHLEPGVDNVAVCGTGNGGDITVATPRRTAPGVSISGT
jgi:hypothetical protein